MWRNAYRKGRWAETAEVFEQAAVRYAAYLYRGKDNGFGANDVTGFPEGGEVPVVQGIPQDVRYLLAPYRSRSGGIV